MSLYDMIDRVQSISAKTNTWKPFRDLT